MKKLFVILSVVLIFTFPVWMWLGWNLQGKKELKAVIIDKTSLTADGPERRSFNWILNNERYCKQNRSLYDISYDFYGFLPEENRQFKVTGFENLPGENIKNIAGMCDMTYYTDTYGVYRSDWYGNNIRGDLSSKIYGGMCDQDIVFLQSMKDQHKLIITEYNDIASPTSKKVRGLFENMFGVRWTGWAGRYFESLDTNVNKELPVWLVRDYKASHNNKWQFKNSGIALVDDNGRVEILEYKKDLSDEMPVILTNETNRNRFRVPQNIKYSYWFDVMLTSHSNNVTSVFQIKTTAKGDSILNAINIPNPFPAVIEHYDKDYKFYYFCGDFCDNPVEMLFSDFRWITTFRTLFYSSNNSSERTNFFWLYYQPLVSSILDNYYNSLNK